MKRTLILALVVIAAGALFFAARPANEPTYIEVIVLQKMNSRYRLKVVTPSEIYFVQDENEKDIEFGNRPEILEYWEQRGYTYIETGVDPNTRRPLYLLKKN